MGFVLFLVGQARLRRVGAEGVYSLHYIPLINPSLYEMGPFYSLTLVYAHLVR